MRRGASPTTIPHDVDERVAIVHPMSPITPAGIQEMPQEEFVFHGVEEQQPQPDAMHYGSKPGHFETSKIHFPTSEGVSEVSKRANE